MRRAKSIFYGILGIILGIVLFFGGVSTLSSPDKVTCGGQTMSQGDTCEHYSNGVQTGTSDYDQEKQSNHGTSILLLIMGPLILIGSIFLLSSGSRRRSPVYPAQNAMYTQMNRQPQPGAYPPGAYPPGTYPPGTYPPGTYPPGAYPPGTYPPGAYPPSSFSSQQPGGPPPPYQPR